MKRKRVGKLIGLAVAVAVMMSAAAGCLSLKSTVQDYGVYDTSAPEKLVPPMIFVKGKITFFSL